MTPPTNPSKRKPAETSGSPASKKAKPSPDFSNPAEMVTIRVGEDGKEEDFAVHREFACHYSPVWDAAFNGRFTEAETQTYRLNDISPNAFRLLVKWLYTQKIEPPKNKDLPQKSDINASLLPNLTSATRSTMQDENANGPSSTTTAGRTTLQDMAKECRQVEDGGTLAIEIGDQLTIPFLERNYAGKEWLIEVHLVQLWIVADHLLIRPLQNAVVDYLDAIWENHRIPRAPLWIPYMYRNTSSKSQLRQLVVDRFAYNMHQIGKVIKEVPFCLPREMMFEVALVLGRSVRPSEYGQELLHTWKDYHVHDVQDERNESSP